MAATAFLGTKYRMAGGDISLDPASLKGTPADKDYLARNRDVADAVTRGEFISGYDHWLQYGKAEYDQGDDTKKFGTPGYDAVKNTWPYKRYYNLALNDQSALTPVSKKNTYLWIMLLVVVAGVAYWKFGKKKKG